MRRIVLVLLALIVAGVLGLYFFAPRYVMNTANKTLDPGPYEVSAEALALHKTLLVADLHCDVFLWERDFLARGHEGHVDFPRMQEGNVALEGITAATRIPAQQNNTATPDKWDVLVPLSFFQGRPAATWFSPTERALHQAHMLHDAAERSNGKLVIVTSQQELNSYLERRKSEPDIAATFLGIEGAHALGSSVDNLDVMYDAGYRMIAPTHFFDNLLGGSAHGLGKFGLSEFGAEVVRRMEDKHMLVDLAHASPKMIDDVLDMATQPIVVSHTGVKGTCDNMRNLSDEHLLRIRDNGGVVGIGFWDTAVCGEDVDHIVAAIQYATDLIGVDHVALGSDYDGAVTAPFDISGMALVTEGLMKAGYNEADIRKIMGENVIRLLREVLPEA
ncbi:MAG: peptidase M19 [Candidatus Hydrogenedens sp.]|nr:peptidase M19 [Candidatus Hydrogenedens sp.]